MYSFNYISYILSLNPLLTPVALAGATAILTRDFSQILAVLFGSFFVIKRLKQREIKSVKDNLFDIVKNSGANYVGRSNLDERALGYDVRRKVLIVALTVDGVSRTREYPISTVRDVSWEIPGFQQNKIYGRASFNTTLQVGVENFKAQRRAIATTGLQIELADIDTPILNINLDADRRRMERWMEILRQAMEGVLQTPEKQTYV